MKPPLLGQLPPQSLIDLAASTRRIHNALLRVDRDQPDIAWALRNLDEVAARLESIGRPEQAPRVAPDADASATRPYYFPGAVEPRMSAAPWMTAEQRGDRRVGRVRFELLHEGPPSCVHGGHVAWMFDQAFGQHVVASEIGAPTHRLEVTYRRPTPMHRELDYEVWTDRIDGRKVFLSAELRDGDALLAEASALFVRIYQGSFEPGVD